MSLTLTQGLLTGNTIGKLRMVPNTKIQERELSITQNQIIQYNNQFMREETWNEIKSTLSSRDEINTLILSGISINASGLKILGGILRSYPQIKNLKLEWNVLFDYPNEFSSFCDAVAASCIVYISLSNNKINSGMCEGIQRMIKSSKSLMYIDLRWNEIGNDGGKMIIAALTSNQNVIELNLIGNKINGDTLREIAEFMSKNREYQNDFVLGPSRKKNEMKQNAISDVEMQIPLKVIEREKALSNEFKARYDVQLVQNAKLENENKSLTKNLEIERGKVIEMKKDYDNAIEQEINARQKLEDNLRMLQEKNSKLIIENNQKDVKIEDTNKQFAMEKENLMLRIKTLEETLLRKEKNYEEKMQILQNENAKINSRLNATIASITKDNEDRANDILEKNKKAIFTFEQKLTESEKMIENLTSQKNKLQSELEEEKKNNLEEKYALEEKYKNRESKIYNDENAKYILMKNELEATIEKLRNENANYSNSDKVQNVPQKSEANIENAQIDKINELTISNANYVKKISSLEAEISSNLIKMKVKDNEIKKLNEQISQFDKYKEKLDKKNNEYAFKKDKELNREKEAFINEKAKLLEKIKELENENAKLKEYQLKLESNIPKTREQIKSTLISYIDSY